MAKLRPCKGCGREISPFVTKCPGCGHPNVDGKDLGIALGCLGVAAVAWFLCCGGFGLGNSGRHGGAVHQPDEFDAQVMAEKFVRKELLSPATAEFPREEITTRKVGPSSWEVRGAVDSQNGFGAVVRTRYTTVVGTTDGKQWTCESLNLGQ